MHPDVKMSVADLEAFLERDFPQIHANGRAYSVVSVGHHTALIQLRTAERHLRPGGTVSGPTLMEFADFAMYMAILAALGPVAMAVTTNLNINFLRKPTPGILFAEARILKLGRRLAVGEVGIRSEGSADLVAHVTSTYSIPDK